MGTPLRRHISGVLLAIGLAGLAAACSGGATTKIEAGAPQTTPVPTPAKPELRPVANLSDQHAAPPFRMAPDPNGGVYYRSRTAQTTDLYHVSPEGKVDERQILDGSENEIPLEFGGLAASGSDVWLGLNQTLVRINGDGVRRIAIPTPRPNAAEFGQKPSKAFPVRAAVASDSIVALALESSADVVLFDPKSETFSSVPLPDGEGATKLALLDDGTLGVAMTNYAAESSQTFGVIRPGDSAIDVVPVKDSTRVARFGDGFLVGTSSDDQMSVDRTGLAKQATGSLPASPVLDLGGGRSLYWTPTAVRVEVTGPSSYGSVDVPMPQIDCSGFSNPGPLGVAQRGNTSMPCPSNSVTNAVADRLGNVWLTFGGQPQQVYVITS